jgi:hypothetical protein
MKAYNYFKFALEKARKGMYVARSYPIEYSGQVASYELASVYFENRLIRGWTFNIFIGACRILVLKFNLNKVSCHWNFYIIN